ncbi:hypothetical protein [Streptomyces sp. NPDC057910]|uniref:hypothetical protein n=1 Tax=Streptomyces sp. NPDC057910 TaxID=3346278 RepID=UPI001DC8D445|nr:hypothetical protein [Streptomyces sp. MAG02]
MNLWDLLHQADVWTDRHGVTHRITDMEPRYCGNVVGFLMRQADQVAFQLTFRATLMRLPDEDTQAFLDVSEYLDAELDRILAAPGAWLIDTPLVRALLARAEQGE